MRNFFARFLVLLLTVLMSIPTPAFARDGDDDHRERGRREERRHEQRREQHRQEMRHEQQREHRREEQRRDAQREQMRRRESIAEAQRRDAYRRGVEQGRQMRNPRPVYVDRRISYDDARMMAVRGGYVGYHPAPAQIIYGSPLPVGIGVRVVPQVMLSGLPVYSGYQWYIAGADLVLIALATGVVVEVYSGVFQ